MLLICFLLVSANGPAASTVHPSDRAHSIRRVEGFVIESHVGDRIALELATSCPAWRLSLTRNWLGREPEPWEVPCRVVVHASEADYLRAVGGLGVPTSGSSLVKNTGPRITARRIDLNGARLPQALAALPHEMAHVVLADGFVETPLPRWADEGIALAADTPEKRARHRYDLERALGGKTWLPLGDLVRLDSYPRRDQIATFYAQSESLVAFLASEKSADKLVPFLKAAQNTGFDRALREHYQIASVAELERRWLRHAMAQRSRDPIQFAAVARRPAPSDAAE